MVAMVVDEGALTMRGEFVCGTCAKGETIRRLQRVRDGERRECACCGRQVPDTSREAWLD